MNQYIGRRALYGKHGRCTECRYMKEMHATLLLKEVKLFTRRQNLSLVKIERIGELQFKWSSHCSLIGWIRLWTHEKTLVTSVHRFL